MPDGGDAVPAPRALHAVHGSSGSLPIFGCSQRAGKAIAYGTSSHGQARPAISAFTRVCDALWVGPRTDGPPVVKSGIIRACAATWEYAKFHFERTEIYPPARWEFAHDETQGIYRRA